MTHCADIKSQSLSKGDKGKDHAIVESYDCVAQAKGWAQGYGQYDCGAQGKGNTMLGARQG